MTITLEDVYQILRFPFHGERVVYYMDAHTNAVYEIMGIDDIFFTKGEIDLEYYRGQVLTFRLIMAAIISRLVAQD